jgi:hypothetical protein
VAPDIMSSMKRLSFLLACCGALTFAAELSTVHSVYILSMSHGFDQFLANSLTNGHTFQVVTDATKADAILTDHIGQTFETQVGALLPAPPPPPAPKVEKKESTGPELPEASKIPPPPSTMSRSRGTLFLVDVKSRQVLWSAYATPKSLDSKELDRTASDIVSRLKKDLNPPVKNGKEEKPAKSAKAPLTPAASAPVAAPAPAVTVPPAPVKK